MTARERDVLYQRYICGYSRQMIANLLGTSRVRALQIQRRALVKLRKKLLPTVAA